MKLRFDKSKIRYYAAKYQEDNPCYDNSVERIVNEVKKRGYLTKADLKILSKWKQKKQNMDLIKENSSSCVEEITRLALSPDTAEPDRIKHLLNLDGVKSAVGSAILHWFHDDPYPIWDKHARYSVHLDKTRITRQPRRGEWEAYVCFFRYLVTKTGTDKRTLDRALWQFSASC